jgi:hypothetical protein
MAHHKCHNGHGYSFKREAMATEVPHLLEHLIIELQAQAQHHDVLKGETQWNWRVDPRGTFHVILEYQNELLVLAAVRLAERIVNSLDAGDVEAVDLPAEMARLRQIATLGEELRPLPPRYAPRPLLLEEPAPALVGATHAKAGRTDSRPATRRRPRGRC